MLWLILAAGGAGAQTLRGAVELAWERPPASQAQRYRLRELAARTQAANAGWPSPPAIGLSESSDRFNRNGDARAGEAELSVPLWLPGQRQFESALAGAKQHLQRDAQHSILWKLIGKRSANPILAPSPALC